jgi:uncharacterized protein YecA (UPF0149 family)
MYFVMILWQIVYTIFRISLKASEEIKQTEVQSSKPVALGGEVGRNDPCPCGSGKKWKKCGMIGAKEHKTSSK